MEFETEHTFDFTLVKDVEYIQASLKWSYMAILYDYIAGSVTIILVQRTSALTSK